MEPRRRASIDVGWQVLAGVFTLVLAAASASPAPAQSIRAGELELDLTGRVQFQFNSTSVDGDDVAAPPAATAFETRRIRFGTNFRYGEWITGKVEADFAGSGAVLADGYVDLAVAGPLHVRAGQFKTPFGVFELESSTRIRTIERGLRIRGLTDVVGVPGETQWLLGAAGHLGRQIGVVVHGEAGTLGYEAGVFNGEGANVRETEGSKAFAGRLTYGVLPSLVLGAAVSDQPTGLFDGADGAAEVRSRAVEVDASWGSFRAEGLHARAEWMLGENPLAGPVGTPATMTGVHALVSWFQPRAGRVEGIEPVLRLSWADPDTGADGDDGMLVTPGLNLYFNGRNRLMVNGDVYLPGQDALDPELALVAQLQVYF
jgi:hypothetical protein